MSSIEELSVFLGEIAEGERKIMGLDKVQRDRLSKAVARYNKAYKRRHKGIMPPIVFQSVRSGKQFDCLVIVRAHEVGAIEPIMEFEEEKLLGVREATFFPCGEKDLNRLRQACHRLRDKVVLSVLSVDGGAIVKPRERKESVADWLNEAMAKYSEPVPVQGNVPSIRASLARLSKEFRIKKTGGEYFLVKK